MKILSFFLCIIFLDITAATSQELITINGTTDTVYRSIQEMPEFPGGITKLKKFIRKNTLYPDEAKKNGIRGQVILQLLISKSGAVTDIKVLRKVGYGCDEEAVNMAKKMPAWHPGIHYGARVNTYLLLPVTFPGK